MPNRLFYTAKLQSSFIIENKRDITANFYDLFKGNMIISLADSQMLRTIRDITNHNIDLEQLEEWYSERDFLKKRKNSPENKKRIWELQNNIYTMMYIPEYVSVVMEETQHYNTFYKKGFKINGDKYVRFSCSASQARVNTVIFIKESIKEEATRILNNGRRMDYKLAPSKFNAYFGLYSSATKLVTYPRFCIIPDFCENQDVDVSFVTETDDFHDDIVDERTIEVEFNRFDGNGLISPEMAEQWSKDIGIYTPDNEEDTGYIACQFCIRQSFTKGMLNVFDFRKFCKEKNDGNYIIKDIYGKDVDLRDIDVILTEGQTKLYTAFGYWEGEEWIPSQEVFEENCKKNKIYWGVTRFTPRQDDRMLVTNYQFLQTLSMNDEDIKELCKETTDYFSGVCYDDYNSSLLFSLGESMNTKKMRNYMKSSDNYWIKSLICNPNLFEDKYTKQKLKDSINRRIEQACVGKILVEGNFQVIVPDSYAFCEWLCYRDPNRVKGLLKAGECYSTFWKERNKKQVLSQRSPLTHFSECHLLDVVWNEEINEWFKYSYTGFYINTHDDSTMKWAGADQKFEVPSYRNVC